jgi:hypothetical protein
MKFVIEVSETLLRDERCQSLTSTQSLRITIRARSCTHSLARSCLPEYFVFFLTLSFCNLSHLVKVLYRYRLSDDDGEAMTRIHPLPGSTTIGALQLVNFTSG